MADHEPLTLQLLLRAITLTLLMALFLGWAAGDSQWPVGLRLVHFQKAWSLERGVVMQGREAASAAWSLPDAEGGSVGPDSPMALASLTKPLTAMALRALAAERRLALTDRVADWLPEIAASAKDPRFRDVTIKHLLQHTAGFDRIKSGDPMFTADGRLLGCGAAIRTAVAGRALDSNPGEVIRYSNVGYCLLGLVINRVTGQDYEVAMQQWTADHSGVAAEILTLGPPRGIAVRPLSTDWAGLSSAGGLVTTANVFLKMMANESAHMEEIAEPPTRGNGQSLSFYGLGWRIWPTQAGPTFTHFGAMDNIFTFAAIYPKGCRAVALFHGRPADDELASKHLQELLRC